MRVQTITRYCSIPCPVVERLLVIGGFLCYCLLLGRWGVERDRPAWRVLACFGCMDVCIELAFPNGFGSDWGPAIYGMKEIVVANALLFFAWSPIAIRMTVVVGLFWVVHLCLYLDIETGSNLIYDHYELSIRGLIVLLAALGTNGIAHAAKGIRDSLLAGNRIRSHGNQLDLSRVDGQKQNSEDKETTVE